MEEETMTEVQKEKDFRKNDDLLSGNDDHISKISNNLNSSQSGLFNANNVFLNFFIG